MDVIIPARGTVRFFAWTYDDEPDYQLDPPVVIDGPREWLRPAVALIVRPSAVNECTGLDADVIVADEVGCLFPANDYLEQLMGDIHWDHASHIYQPHVDGPVADGPRIRRPYPEPGHIVA